MKVMKARTSSAWLLFAALALSLAVARPALAEPTCKKQLRAYDRWTAPIAADIARGAFSAQDSGELVAVPFRRSELPKQPAMTLVVDGAGLRDGTGPVRPASEAAALIDSNRNIAFAKTNANAIARGVLVAATRKAPASSVRAAIEAAAAAGQPVWLVFRPSDRKSAAPRASSVTAELDAIDSKDVMGALEIVQREFGTCDGLMTMMRKLAGQTTSSRLATLVKAPSPALAKCRCTPKPGVVASILWKLIFDDLATLVPVPPKRIATLSWGDARSRWQDVAPAIVKALRASK